MIIMGAGTNHWFHSDTIYRAFLALTTLTGCQGINGGGWAHYVGQEKCRPVTGWSTLAFALDWARPPRQMIQTAYWYLHTDQWRYDHTTVEGLASPLGSGRFAGKTAADVIAQSARMGWMPSHPTFDRNPLDLADEIAASDQSPGEYVVERLKSGELRFACEDPDAPENFPRVLTIWRANLLGSSSKGNEYFLKHLLGTDSSLRATEAPPEARPKDVVWREQAPTGKLDLLVNLDFRMTSTTVYSDVVLPAATWYEKHDLNTTDMHPFVHSFNPAIAPPWQTRTDFAIFKALVARSSAGRPRTHLGVRKDLVAAPLTHDTPDEYANPHGIVRDWKAGECDPVPGVSMPKLAIVERDYGAVGEKWAALGPLVEKLGLPVKGMVSMPDKEVGYLRGKNGAVRGGAADGRPSLARDVDWCEAILALAGTTNGRVATTTFQRLEERTGMKLADLAAEHEGKLITFADTQARPVPVITSPEWSGSEHGGRRYSPFTVNVERLKPWHTLTGRQHFFLDHDWMTELGEQMPVFRPPLDMNALYGEPRLGRDGRAGADAAVPDPAQQVVDPLGVPGQPVHALAVPRGPAHLDERPGRREDRRPGQRLDRGRQPQRRRGGPGDRLAPDARGHRLHAPRPGPADRRPAGRDLRQARWHPQLADAALPQTQPSDRRIRAAVVRLQLPGPDGQPTRRGHRDPEALPGGRY